MSEGSIEELVHRFYDAVRDDPVLGPIFAKRIEEHEWPAHLDRMRAFWSTALLATGTYRGNPMLVHVALEGVGPQHFARWLTLFEATAEAVLEPDVARAVVARAHRMGARLLAAISESRGSTAPQRRPNNPWAPSSALPQTP
ncbi:MAG: group III truncated hemoglobin [Planctomycetota bacterium]